ncbi:MAG TPA: Eco57I restriction-modification methylase domain-containing protein [Dissulfurispiraceae bacterium]|nr:Eco57I restriction-modification methylase domain-containing protein [Dissulfurispiraceae bacterium]
MSELKTQIQTSLAGFASGQLRDNAKALLNVLGYSSDRTFQLTPNTFEGLSEYFDAGRTDENKIKKADWQSVDIIFQLTDDDIKKIHSLFEAKQVDNTIIESYLFFALALTGSNYTRGDLVKITREINRLTPMPAMVFFRYGDCLTIAIIDRRLHKREGAKDVLEKVTLIKDINIAKPHRAHIEILSDLSLDGLAKDYSVANFVALHKAWQKTLDTSELNKRFYRELANWYFWAVQQVEFPADAEKNRDVRNATGVIRLLTRLIFIWFIKEKGLVPDDLFNQLKLKQIINYSDRNQSTYYKAILQNLFFATLNTEMNKDKPGSRKFRGKRQEGRDQHYMIHNVFRYAELFSKPNEALNAYFENIPFLNGGLFECLDKTIKVDGKDIALRIDGFSERHDNALKVPDHLFFAAEQPVDLNGIYGTRNKTYKVKGLINILDSYKFTVDENTPVEEEIALDPELLGKVFENLLASYNPETQSTARKQTGSFYTPREIVNYMVDESLIASLQSKVALADGDTRIRHLLSYTEEQHMFIDAEGDSLIDAIDGLKILDPACGSGAFPMGILHKLAFILGKLDPHNDKWREKQRQKAIKETEEAYRIGEQEERQKRLLDIDDAFENNASDYGRKLYLIENCIFGVDIQPIAVQIAKLRFFISLIVDQQINPDRANLGVRPLPNLETKFVAANTLIGIEKPAQLLLRNPEIDKKEKELKEVRERHFTARTPQTKEKYRKADERLRAEVSGLLEQDGFPRATTEQLAHWNPYDQNASAGFFDTEWMFGVTDGFDVVIGNPPYVRQEAIKDSKPALQRQFAAFYCGTADLYTYFYKRGLEILKPSGHLCFIAPNKFMRAGYGKNTRKLLAGEATPKVVIDFGDLPIFDATTYPSILLIEKTPFALPANTKTIVGAGLALSASVDDRAHANGRIRHGGANHDRAQQAAPLQIRFRAATFTDAAQLERLEETLAGC